MMVLKVRKGILLKLQIEICETNIYKYSYIHRDSVKLRMHFSSSFFCNFSQLWSRTTSLKISHIKTICV